jgi:uncharacterized protein YbaP (TraB family)
VYYQIENTNVRLAGSLHLVPAGKTLPNWILEAYQWSEDLYLEANDADTAKLALLPSGESWERRLPAAIWTSIKAAWPAHQPPLGPQKPWFIAMVLGMSGIPLLLGVENFIKARAKADSRCIQYLETVGEFSQLMEGVTDADYARAFAVVLANDAQTRGQNIADMYRAWMSAQVDAVEMIARQSPLGQFPVVREIIFDRRNLLWLPRIVATLGTNRRTVVFVGAGHLGGPNGLLALLGRAGHVCQRLV